MSSLSLKEERICTLRHLNEILEALLKNTDNYINTFEKKDFFVFSDSDSRGKRYKNEYYKFAVSVADDLLLLDRTAGEISSLVIRADMEMNDEELLILQGVFDQYLSFKNSSSSYFASTEKMLISQSVSVSVLLDGAMKFKFSISALIEKAL